MFTEGWSAATSIPGTRSRAGPGALQLLLRQWAGHGVNTARAGWQERHRPLCHLCSVFPHCTWRQGGKTLLTWGHPGNAWAIRRPSPVSARAFLVSSWPLMLSSLCCLSALQPPGTGSAAVPEDRSCFRSWPDPCSGRPSARLESNK